MGLVTHDNSLGGGVKVGLSTGVQVRLERLLRQVYETHHKLDSGMSG